MKRHAKTLFTLLTFIGFTQCTVSAQNTKLSKNRIDVGLSTTNMKDLGNLGQSSFFSYRRTIALGTNNKLGFNAQYTRSFGNGSPIGTTFQNVRARDFFLGADYTILRWNSISVDGGIGWAHKNKRMIKSIGGVQPLWKTSPDYKLVEDADIVWERETSGHLQLEAKVNCHISESFGFDLQYAHQFNGVDDVKGWSYIRYGLFCRF